MKFKNTAAYANCRTCILKVHLLQARSLLFYGQVLLHLGQCLFEPLVIWVCHRPHRLEVLLVEDQAFVLRRLRHDVEVHMGNVLSRFCQHLSASQGPQGRLPGRPSFRCSE